jgi:hypothetical protein
MVESGPASVTAFQTLIGTVKRRPGGTSGAGHSVFISNPHRYGQKGVLDGGGAFGPEKFQTLIDTVKRMALQKYSGITTPFQTLIGTVKRPGGVDEGVELIDIISNPHRYGQKATRA